MMNNCVQTYKHTNMPSCPSYIHRHMQACTHKKKVLTKAIKTSTVTLFCQLLYLQSFVKEVTKISLQTVSF